MYLCLFVADVVDDVAGAAEHGDDDDEDEEADGVDATDLLVGSVLASLRLLLVNHQMLQPTAKITLLQCDYMYMQKLVSFSCLCRCLTFGRNCHLLRYLQFSEQCYMNEISVLFVLNAVVPAAEHLVGELSELVVTHEDALTKTPRRTEAKSLRLT